MKERRYLARELTIAKKGEVRRLSLHYVCLADGTIETGFRHLDIIPFDRERAGFEYISRLSIVREGDVWRLTGE